MSPFSPISPFCPRGPISPRTPFRPGSPCLPRGPCSPCQRGESSLKLAILWGKDQLAELKYFKPFLLSFPEEREREKYSSTTEYSYTLYLRYTIGFRCYYGNSKIRTLVPFGPTSPIVPFGPIGPWWVKGEGAGPVEGEERRQIM